MRKYILLVSLTTVLLQGSIMGEVPDFSITPHNSSYGDFHFTVDYYNRTLMHNQFKIYTIAISITPEARKNIEQDGYISIWRDNIFVYSDTIYPTRYDDVPLPLKEKVKNKDAIIFTFDINPQYISRSWFNYQIRRNDGTVEINCVVKLKDFISFPKNHEEKQIETIPKVSESDVDSKELLEKADSVRPDNLGVLWTSGDPAVAHKVCFMYTHNAKKGGWWKQVQLIVWGPSSKLLAEDKKLQDAVKAMIADGVVVKACKACSDSYGVSDDLAALGIDVKYMGQPLTRMLKSDQWQVLTF